MSLVSLSKLHLSYKWLVTIAITFGMFMSLMDSTIVNVAIPQMQQSFGADIHEVQWVVTIYMLTQAAVIPTAPYLTAKFGGKQAYVWTLSAFLLGSLLCGFAWNLQTLHGESASLCTTFAFHLNRRVLTIASQDAPQQVCGFAFRVGWTSY